MTQAHYQPGDPAAADTLPHFIKDVAAAYGDSIAIRLDDDSLSFKQLEEQSSKLARGLIARGIGKGSRVGFIMGNGPNFLLYFAAIARAGAIAVPISTFIKADELVRVLRQSDIAGLIVQRSQLGKDYVERLCEALPSLKTSDTAELQLSPTPFLRWIVSSGESLPASIHDISWLTDASDKISELLLDEIESEIHPTDQVLEVYTSGSMALPKGVKHSHGAIMSRTHYLQTMLPCKPGMEITVPLPMFWVGGLMMYLFPNMQVGATTVCTEGTQTNSRFAMGSVLAEEDKLSRPAGLTIWALGMTETLGPYSYADVEREPGYPLCPPLDHIADNFEVRIANEKGEELPAGEVGEIQVRGYALTAGLHKMHRENYFTADGFYHTGDLGLKEKDRIHFVGRDGDMIKTVGSNVSPAEVELEMQQLEGIHSAYVVGIPDKERGQLVVAAVVLRDGVTVNFDEVEHKLRERLSSYKVPRAYRVITREQVPMLPSNKVAKREIARMMEEYLSTQQ